MNRKRAVAVKSPAAVTPSPGLPLRGEQISLACRAVAEEFRPDKIVLFGSYAYGQPDADSDIDLLVIMPFEGSPFRQAGIILNYLVGKIGVLPLDLLVRTREQVKERLDINDRFMQEITERGRVMYEADHA
jgi:predicted nucleotidyltransferase